MRVSRADTELGQEFPEAEIIRREITSWQPTDRLPLHWLRVLPDAPSRRRSRKLRLALVAAIVAGTVVLTLSTVGGAGGVNWWASMQNAAHDAVKQFSPPSAPAQPSNRPVGAIQPAPSQPSPTPIAVPGQPAPTPSASATGGGGSSAPGAVNVTVTSVPVTSPKPQGVTVGAPPQGVMTGSVSEGPVYAGGTIYQNGVGGCIGVLDQQTGTYICGTVTEPVVLPLPSLPAPKVPDATQVTSIPSPAP